MVGALGGFQRAFTGTMVHAMQAVSPAGPGADRRRTAAGTIGETWRLPTSRRAAVAGRRGAAARLRLADPARHLLRHRPAGTAGGSDPAAAASSPTRTWWRGFRSAELDGLMADAMAANTDIAGAVARVRQADAHSASPARRCCRRWTLRSQALRSQTGGVNTASITGLASRRVRVTASDRAILSASYEIDFWGKNRSQVEAAEQSAFASRFDVGTVTLTTQASVANTYFAMLGAQDRLAIQQQNLEIAQRVLRVIRDRVVGRHRHRAGTGAAGNRGGAAAGADPAAGAGGRDQPQLARHAGGPPAAGDCPCEGGTFNALDVPPVTPGLPRRGAGPPPGRAECRGDAGRRPMPISSWRGRSCCPPSP